MKMQMYNCIRSVFIYVHMSHIHTMGSCKKCPQIVTHTSFFSTSFAIWLCSSSHQKLESISPSFKSGLALRLCLLWPKEHSRSNGMLIQSLSLEHLHTSALSRGPRRCHMNKLRLSCWQVRDHIDHSYPQTCERTQPREGKLIVADHRWMKQPAWNKRTTQLSP